MKLIRGFKKVLNKINGFYRNKLTESYNRKMKNPIKNMFFDTFKGVSLFMLLILVYFIISPALRSSIDYYIEKYTDTKNEIAKLSQDLINAKKDMYDAYVASLKQFKNPTFEGITISTIDGLTSIYPSSTLPKKKIYYFQLAKWAKEEGYDSVIFGDSYSGLNGTFYWSDGKDPKYDTDFELIINILKKKGCQSTFSFISNSENKTLTPFVTNYIVGSLTISKSDNYRLDFDSIKLWKCGVSTIISADNFRCDIDKENRLQIVRRPLGENNFVVEHLPQKKGVVKIVKDSSFNLIRRVKALVNMADMIGE